MSVRKIFLVFSSAAAVVCLVMGMGFERWWLGGLISVFLTGCVGIGVFRNAVWIPSACLGGYAAASAAGLLAGGSPYWLAYGACASLVSWDLILFSLGDRGAAQDGLSRRCEREHLRTLSIAAGLGLILVTAGMSIQFRIPFGLMLAAFAVALAGLLLTWWLLQNKNQDNA